MNIFNLTGKLVLNSDEYKKGIDEAKKKNTELETSTSKMSLKAIAGWAGIALSIASVVNGIKKAITSTMQYADTINNLAQLYGKTAKEIQEVNYLAQETGKTAEWALRKAKSSGQEYWQVLGYTEEQYKKMIDDAHEMGIVVEDEIINNIDKMNDSLNSLKYQWQAVLANLLGGGENAEEALQQFLDRVEGWAEKNLPRIISFVIKLLKNLVVGLVRVLPELVGQLLDAVIDAIFEIDWVQVGIDLAKAILQGLLNSIIKALNKLFGWLGVNIPEVDFRGGESSYIDTNSNYEITERSEQSISIKIESDGVTANDKAVAKSLEDLIDEKIGNMLGGI